MGPLSLVLLLVFIYILYNGVEFLILGRRITTIESITPLDPHEWPKISIIIPACNEEKQLLTAMNTIAAMDYPSKEIIIINDRSTDGTGKLIDKLAENHKNIRAIHIDTLEPGWMGKNYALSQGVKHAAGEWLLFTDADVSFQASVLKRAMTFVKAHRLDHLAMIPKVEKATRWFNIMMLLVITFYFLMGKPWRCRYAWSKRSVGQGSFNLVKMAVYKKIDGHKRIRLNSDDDVKLGQLIKSGGYRQDILQSNAFVHVPWYHSLPAMLKGLEKNIFSYLNYSVPLMILFTLFTIVLFYLPLIGLFIFHGLPFILSAATALLTIFLFTIIARQYHYPLWYSLMYPVTLLIDYYVSWRSVHVVLKHKGVCWRGTTYPLSEIKKHHVKTNF